MVLSEVEETVTTVEVDEETYEEMSKVRAYALAYTYVCTYCTYIYVCTYCTYICSHIIYVRIYILLSKRKLAVTLS
jgi:hypothetical protein